MGDEIKVPVIKAEEVTEAQRDATAARLKSFVERVERLEEERAALAEDVKGVMAEAKASGFDTKIIKKVIRLRKMDEQKRREEQELLDLYASAVGITQPALL